MKNLVYNITRDRLKEEKKKKDEPSGDKLSVTHQAITINGIQLNFTATCGYMKMKDDQGELKAKIFFTSYEKDGVKDMSTRPVTFCFNGGPGCSSPWLHFGAMGPKRAVLTSKGHFLPPPGKLVDNQYTWLDFTDLVFIDPVGTGYSRPAKDQDPAQFYGVREDVESVGEFIRLFISKHKRWGSPRFIAGESYGTTRAAGLAGYIQDGMGIDLNGVILISSVLNFLTIRFKSGNDLPYVLYLPAYTATALYHDKLEPALKKDPLGAMAEIERWAIEEYMVALAKGDSLPDKEREKVVDKLSRYTGLSRDFIKNNNLRIDQTRFSKELLRSEGRILGRLDSRYKGTERDMGSNWSEYDPSFFKGPFFGAVNDYVRTTLKYENDIPYTPVSESAHMAWNWQMGDQGDGFVNVADTLRREMDRNPYLQVFVACGYYDMATPYYGAVYTMNHLALEPDQRNRICLEYYDSGHMVYFSQEGLVKFTGDVKRFVEKAVRQEPREID